MPSSRLLSRLKQELESFSQAGDDSGVTIDPDESNALCWTATMRIPEGDGSSPFEGGVFKLRIFFSEEYPNRPPNVTFITKIFHPNVYTSGLICVNILNRSGCCWKPDFTVKLLLISLRHFLDEPYAQSPANPEAAKLFRTNYAGYKDRVKQLIQAQLKGDHETEAGILFNDNTPFLNIWQPFLFRRDEADAVRLRFEQDCSLLAQMSSNESGLVNYRNLRSDSVSNVLILRGTFVGPADTHFANQEFDFFIRFSSVSGQLPNSVVFSGIHHPNFHSSDGRLDRELLSNWNIRNDQDNYLETLLLMIKSLFYEPNSNFIVNPGAVVRVPTKLTNLAKGRLIKEAARWRTDPETGISIGLVDENDMATWQAAVVGPIDSAYSFEIFTLSIEIPADYPFTMPEVKFVNPPISLPFVNADGSIPSLSKIWSPTKDILDLLTAIRDFLREPSLLLGEGPSSFPRQTTISAQ